MKRLFIIICMMAMVMTACRKPEPGINPDSNDTTDTLVKKYLVKQLFNDEPERIMLAIDWNDDCSKILHVKHGLGYGSILDYDFTYYNEDSIRVIFSMPQFSYPLADFWYDSIMIHLQQEKIDSICCYDNGTIWHVEKYRYDENGNIIERTYLFGTKDTFQWEGDNVIKACLLMNDYEFNSFTKYIHPHYNLPFYLSNYVSGEIPSPLFTPLWKYAPETEFFDYEADEDNYVIKAIAKKTDRFYTYYYRKIN